jgi:hypothetical protein
MDQFDLKDSTEPSAAAPGAGSNFAGSGLFVSQKDILY